MTTINQKDADQDQLIALLTHRVEDAEKLTGELRDRVRKLERWVWGAGAIISAAITIIGIALAAEAHAFTDDSLTGEPCATEISFSSVVEEVSVKPSEETE